MEGSKKPSAKLESSMESDYDPTKGFCLYTLVQFLRGSEKDKQQITITDAVEHACNGSLETHHIGAMRIDHCHLQCRRAGCEVSVDYWEQTVEGDETYLYTLSKEIVDKLGCIREQEGRRAFAKRNQGQPRP